MTQLTADFPGTMTGVETGPADPSWDAGHEFTAAPAWGGPALVRSRWIAVPFALPVLSSAISYLYGGMPFLTDFAFISLTALCLALLLRELAVFPRRFGVGGLVLFGGTLLWFSYDYIVHWLGVDFQSPAVPASRYIIAKTAFYHCLFLQFAVAGLLVRRGRWLERLIHAVPEPSSERFYFWLILVMFAIGISPFFLFGAKGGFATLWTAMIAGRSEMAEMWTVGRTGNLNYSWGGYIVQIMQVGQVGAQLAALYALLVARTPFTKGICWAIWALWAALAFGTGTRGEVIFVALPVVALLFLKLQAQAAERGARFGLRAYVICGVMLLAMLAVVQIQAIYRNSGFLDVDTSEVSLTKLQGNSMFSEGLNAYEAFGESRDFVYNTFPGAGVLRPIPETLFWFAIGPIPRALWNDKPIDQAWAIRARGRNGMEDMQGTTFSTGLVGNWYVRYGLFGVIEGGLLFGWLIGVAERALQGADGRPMRLMLSLGILVWLFRCFRDFYFHDLYPLLIGGAVIYALVKVQNFVVGGGGDPPAASPWPGGVSG